MQPIVTRFQPLATPASQSDPPPGAPTEQERAYVAALERDLAAAKRSRSADVEDLVRELRRAQGVLDGLLSEATKA